MWLGDDLFEALLIQKDVKPWTYLVGIALSLRFESFVNLEGCKTNSCEGIYKGAFESFVNLEGCKTISAIKPATPKFESFVNLEGCKTASFVDKSTDMFESFVNLEGCKTRIRICNRS